MQMQVKDANGATQTVNTLPGPGQTTSGNSLPVVIASDQSAVPVSGPLTQAQLQASGLATAANQPGLNGDGGALAHITNFPSRVANFADVQGSPFSLNSSWQKVTTVTAQALGLLVGDTSAGQAQHDIFWTTVTAGGSAPLAGVLGMPVGQKETFPGILPLGDLYLRSPSGAVATVRQA